MIGAALSAVLALVHINASSATHVVAVAAPALLAGLYAITRTMHKSALASALADVFPQVAGAGPAAPHATPPPTPQPTAQPIEAQPASGTPVAATAQTDPDFVFEGIPPIDNVDG